MKKILLLATLTVASVNAEQPVTRAFGFDFGVVGTPQPNQKPIWVHEGFDVYSLGVDEPPSPLTIFGVSITPSTNKVFAIYGFADLPGKEICTEYMNEIGDVLKEKYGEIPKAIPLISKKTFGKEDNIWIECHWIDSGVYQLTVGYESPELKILAQKEKAGLADVPIAKDSF